IASGNGDNTARLWDAQTGAPGLTLCGHTSHITSVVCSPSGQQIASGSHDNTVRLWDVNSGQCLAVVEDFHGSITSITWNATFNGTYFATGCSDMSVRMWQVIEEEDRYQVRLH
ncbi:WD40-repeat-containing domain protein, partial [Gamsiella multidivaricata]|uniref:WD40-repeat-containing domain protein n=1 Tax=Gamsiella multidivaricata TaxID=101098 RepID=UPI00221F9B46